MLIRRLAPSDAPAFLALRLAALRQCPSAFSSSYEEECDTPVSEIERRLSPDSGRFNFGAFDGDALVGMLVLGREEGNKVRHKGFIRAVFVAPSHRGQGVARLLVEQALDTAMALEGLQQLTLSVTAGNAVALGLYQSLGFDVVGQAPRALLVDGAYHDDIYMVRHLHERTSAAPA
ncbi:MAG: GNAT family N-acetyltransferase [Bdellovibrionales bacterium]|nr:GNAT family N-acetyltransferase [Massilia sp.]